ncbi:hypothetical protein G4Y79_04210 [Phototrophicus methaneseepsis]|uniref:DUF4231 domain-containing protein n=1 Tax=Phototrophicus methaneseepsis TaxID=2710758 RepID=A0A7S8IFL4_9CHLR|nr:hypothetical protein [Phototrophicus methaneseepsis]QPC83594.1 hypothetical protein G4Y79_04210 [Phototrophicus methaneseepsis]
MSETAPNSSNLDVVVRRAKKTIERTRDEVRAYLPSLVQRLGLTFGVPILVAFFVATIGAMIVSQFIPSSTTSILAFGLNIAIMVFGWRYLEGRYRGTSAFIVYTRYSRTRRDLEKMIEKTPAGSDTSAEQIETQREGVVKAADAFLQAMQEMGAQPTSTE